jgi:hypothetical protein
MEILTRVVKKSIMIILPAVAVSYAYQWEKVPAGIIAGWLLGIINLRSLSRNVKGLIGSEKAAAKIVFLSLFRLVAVLAIIAVLLRFRVINVFGLLFGFTAVFALILFEGYRIGKSN